MERLTYKEALGIIGGDLVFMEIAIAKGDPVPELLMRVNNMRETIDRAAPCSSQIEAPHPPKWWAGEPQLSAGQVFYPLMSGFGVYEYYKTREERDAALDEKLVGDVAEKEAIAQERLKLDDGWIEWKGGKCPVAPRTMVRFRLRGGWESEYPADYCRWRHAEPFDENLRPEYDIIAYKVIE